jgi:hypothetical protein
MSYTIINGLKLRRGSLYEFRKKLSSNNLLGAYRGARYGSTYFSVLADSSGGGWHYSSMSVGLKEFEFLKLVPIEELPLYIGWPWKTHYFTDYLKKGLKS